MPHLSSNSTNNNNNSNNGSNNNGGVGAIVDNCNSGDGSGNNSGASTNTTITSTTVRIKTDNNSDNSAGADDLGSTDEIKVFKDEGDVEDDKTSENLNEEKNSLIDFTESEEKCGSAFSNATKSLPKTPSDHGSVFGKFDSASPSPQSSCASVVAAPSSTTFNMGYIVSPYGYPNGTTAPIPVSVASKMGLAAAAAGAALPFFCHNGDHLSQPPPAHMGIPPYQLETPRNATSGIGLTRPPIYPFTPSQYTYSMLSSEMSQVAASWHTSGMYSIPTAGASFRSPYPSSLPISNSSLSGEFYRFSPTGLISPHPSLSTHSSHPLSNHHAIVIPTSKQDPNIIVNGLCHSRSSSADNNTKSSINCDKSNNNNNNTPNSNNHHSHLHQQHHHLSQSQSHQHSRQQHHTSHQPQHQQHTHQNQQQQQHHPDNNNIVDKKKPHIKKPLNAFMLYMKEMRAKVVAECTLKESAAINQILGRKWHALGREEQAKYYELARRERQLHMQLYPDWSSRTNATRGKKKKSKQNVHDATGGNNMKKCRARFGLDQQSQWCKPCRRKKKCIRYLEMNEIRDTNGVTILNNNNNNNQLNENQNPCSCGSTDENNTAPDDDSESLSQSISSPMSSTLSRLSSLTSPSMILPSPSTSLASPAVSLSSPCMTSIHSPLNPHDTFESKIATNTAALNAVSIVGISMPVAHRNPVGTNPHDINNPLSVNQLTGQYIKS